MKKSKKGLYHLKFLISTDSIDASKIYDDIEKRICDCNHRKGKWRCKLETSSLHKK